MSKTKHTPGPWEVVDYNIEVTKGTTYTVNNRGGVGAHELRANARLIAAAPDMLEALKNIIHELWLDDMSNFEQGQIKALEDGIKAINKATGSADK